MEAVGGGYDSEVSDDSRGSGDVSNIDRSVTFGAVAWIDKRTLPPEDAAITVIESDVTFGVTNPDTGFDKYDVYYPSVRGVDRGKPLARHASSARRARGRFSTTWSSCARSTRI